MNRSSKWFCLPVIVIALISLFLRLIVPIHAEKLESTNFSIEDATVDSGGQGLSSANLSLLATLGDISTDARLISNSYALQSGFPNGIVANIPRIRCAETTSTSANTNCLHFPNGEGAVGECGAAGCYDKAKIELSGEDNPYDTVYLVKVTDLGDSSIYYLKSDHTLGTTYDASNFMTICQLEGVDPENPGCNDPGDPAWNADLQRYNVLNLAEDKSYSFSVQALNGDFSGTRFSEAVSATTTLPNIEFDIDIADVNGGATETDPPYSVAVGQTTVGFPSTADDLIWFNLGTNLPKGMNIFARSSTNGLYSEAKDATIPSESEDLATDPNNNGGFGLKIYNYSPSQQELGPLQKSVTYNTAGAHEVGQLSTANSLLFFTNNVGTNKGQLLSGRGAVYVKTRAATSTIPAGDYATTMTVVVVGNN